MASASFPPLANSPPLSEGYRRGGREGWSSWGQGGWIPARRDNQYLCQAVINGNLAGPAPGPDAPWLRQKIAEVTGGPTYGRGWLPVLDFGVRVNIEPLKAADTLPRAADRIE